MLIQLQNNVKYYSCHIPLAFVALSEVRVLFLMIFLLLPLSPLNIAIERMQTCLQSGLKWQSQGHISVVFPPMIICTAFSRNMHTSCELGNFSFQGWKSAGVWTLLFELLSSILRCQSVSDPFTAFFTAETCCFSQALEMTLLWHLA